jgi:hypothetical protein
MSSSPVTGFLEALAFPVAADAAAAPRSRVPVLVVGCRLQEACGDGLKQLAFAEPNLLFKERLRVWLTCARPIARSARVGEAP